jgi:hypothetical protein
MQSNPSTEPNHGTITVSRELFSELRVATAEEGVTYDEYLRENLSLTD